MGNVHQNYADSIFEVASHRLGRQVAAPRVLHAFDDEPGSALPAAYATEAASKSSYPPLSISSSSPTSVSYNPSPTSCFELDATR